MTPSDTFVETGDGPIARSSISIEVDPRLRPGLARRSDGRSLVIDSFRSWNCGTWVGDLTVEWWAADPGPDFVELDPLDGVRVFAQRRLLRVLEEAGATLTRGLLPFGGGLALRLERPELWIDYLEARGRPGGRRPLGAAQRQRRGAQAT